MARTWINSCALGLQFMQKPWKNKHFENKELHKLQRWISGLQNLRVNKKPCENNRHSHHATRPSEQQHYFEVHGSNNAGRPWNLKTATTVQEHWHDDKLINWMQTWTAHGNRGHSKKRACPNCCADSLRASAYSDDVNEFCNASTPSFVVSGFFATCFSRCQCGECRPATTWMPHIRATNSSHKPYLWRTCGHCEDNDFMRPSMPTIHAVYQVQYPE